MLTLNFPRDIDKRWTKFAFIAIAFFYLATVSLQWWPTPDSSLYLGLGKSIVSGNGYTFNGETSNGVTPGFPLIIAGIMKIFGQNYLALNLFSALCALVSLWLMYNVLVKLTDNRRLVLTAVICTALCCDYYRLSREILTDPPFCVFFWLIMYCTVKFRDGKWPWLILIGLLTLAGLTVRIPGVFILLPLAAGLFINWPGRTKSWGKRISISAVLFILSTALTCFFVYLSQVITTHAPLYLTATVKSGGRLNTISSFITKILEGCCELPRTLSDMTISQESMIFGLVLLVLLVTGCVIAWRKSLGFMVILCGLTLLGYAIMSGAIGVRTRYLLSLIPIFYILMIWGGLWWWYKIATWAHKPLPGASSIAYALVGFAIVLAGFNVPKIIKVGVLNAIQSYSPNYYKHLRNGEFTDLMAVSSMFAKDNSNPQIYAAEISRLYYLSGKVIHPLPEYDLKTAKEAQNITEFVCTPDVQGYIVIDLKQPLAKQVTDKLDSDTNFATVYNGKYLKVYRK